MAVMFFIIGAVYLIHVFFNNSMHKFAFLCVLLFYTISTAVFTFKESYLAPYRIKPISENKTPILNGPNKNKLYIDSVTAQTLNKFLSAAIESGWSAETPLIGILWRWSSTLPYLLDAKVPLYVYPTIFGWGGSIEMARFNFINRPSGFELNEAWVLIDNPQELASPNWSAMWDYGKKHHDNRVEQVTEVLSILEIVSGRKFPEGYELAVGDGPLQLWKPKADL
jgi:hypothetical protein